MWRNIIPYMALFFLFPVGLTAQKNAGPKPERPPLVVGIVVDQMRYDYLYKFARNYGEDGFNRLLNRGANFRKAYVPYVPSYTAPGHACIYTGSVPALHGIVGNDWIERNTGKEVYCVSDESVRPVGSSSDAGKMSPRNLKSSTITDEYLLGSNFEARAFGVSIKDRGAILPAGHLGKAFWYDPSVAGFISSSFYYDILPRWAQKFNEDKLVDKYYDMGWNLLLDKNKYYASRPDDNQWEGIPNDGTSTFPHELKKYKGVSNDIIRVTPYGNTMTLEFAKSIIENEKLGSAGHTDFLAVSLSSTDYIGHMFGPQSLEIEDTYIRLDRDLEAFFQYLDKTVGKDNYVVFLTADHGAAHNAGYLDSLGMTAGYFWQKEEYDNLKKALDKEFGRHDFFEAIINYCVHLDETKFGDLDADEVYEFITEFYEKDERVTFALNLHESEAWIAPQRVREMVMNNVYKKRSGDIMLLTTPQYYSGYAKTGTTHGTWNPYDTHIPLLFYGHGIPAVTVYDEVLMTDIAPTVADILSVQEPNAAIGKSLYPYFLRR